VPPDKPKPQPDSQGLDESDEAVEAAYAEMKLAHESFIDAESLAPDDDWEELAEHDRAESYSLEPDDA
jgi:hypothetical protein